MTASSSLPSFMANSHGAPCRVGSFCDEAVKCDPASGRWYITIGHAGFNAPANNGLGYRSARSARAVVARCDRGGAR